MTRGALMVIYLFLGLLACEPRQRVREVTKPAASQVPEALQTLQNTTQEYYDRDPNRSVEVYCVLTFRELAEQGKTLKDCGFTQDQFNQLMALQYEMKAKGWQTATFVTPQEREGLIAEALELARQWREGKRNCLEDSDKRQNNENRVGIGPAA